MADTEEGTPLPAAEEPPTHDPNISIASTDPADENLNAAPEETPAEETPAAEAQTADEIDDEEEIAAAGGDDLEAAGEEEETPEVEGEDKPKKKRRRRYTNQARINHAMRRAYRAEAENKALKAAAETAETETPAPRRAVAPVKEEPKVEAPKAPVREDFEDVEDFIVAKTKFEMRSELDDRLKQERLANDTRANVERDRQTAAEADEAQALELGDWQAAVDKQSADPATPDFDDVIDASKDVPINAPMRDFMMDSPAGPRMLYELAKNVELADQIHSLPPLRALAAMGRLEASLDEAPPTPAAAAAGGTPKPRARLPKPPNPVGSSSTAAPVDLDTADYQTYKRVMNKREREHAERR